MLCLKAPCSWVFSPASSLKVQTINTHWAVSQVPLRLRQTLNTQKQARTVVLPVAYSWHSTFYLWRATLLATEQVTPAILSNLARLSSMLSFCRHCRSRCCCCCCRFVFHVSLSCRTATQLATDETSPPFHADEPRVILVFNRTLSLQSLPVALFSSGHVAWVQRTPGKCVRAVLSAPPCCHTCANIHAFCFPLRSGIRFPGCRLGIVPMAVHATFVQGGNEGKVARFR